MITYTLNEQAGILHVSPQGKLQAADFEQLANRLDAYLQSHPKLKGLIIETPRFPGWENFAAFKAHMKFIKEHYQRVEKIALVSDTKLAPIAEKIIPFILNIPVKHCPYGQLDAAKQWMESFK